MACQCAVPTYQGGCREESQTRCGEQGGRSFRKTIRNQPNQLMRALVGGEWQRFSLQTASANKLSVRDSSLYSPCHIHTTPTGKFMHMISRANKQ